MKRKHTELPEIQALLDKGLTRKEIESKEMIKAAKLLSEIHVKVMGEILNRKPPLDDKQVKVAVALIQTINLSVFTIQFHAELRSKLRSYGFLPDAEGEQ